MTNIILPATIELEINIEEAHKQFLKNQKIFPIILFGEKYMIQEFKFKGLPYPDLKKAVVKLVRFED